MFDSTYHIFRDYDVPFDEKGNQCGVIRKVQWVKNGEEPDESKAKIEIRKMIIKPDGSEAPGKGYTFMTPDGPNELTENLVKIGFGNTKELLRTMRFRKDFKDSIDNIDTNDEGPDSGEMFDMRDLLLSISNSSNEEDNDIDDEEENIA